jgi:hypothetical protein
MIQRERNNSGIFGVDESQATVAAARSGTNHIG